MSDWCILRTSGRHTLALARSLGAAGFGTWAPQTQTRKRAPRTNERSEQPAPLLPTYVFARTDRLSDLLGLANADRHAHPEFSVFHYFDRIPIIADCELDPLRAAEAKSIRRRREKREFNQGDVVSVDDGPWTGLSGIVQQAQGNYAMVLFRGMSVRVATFLLHPASGQRVAA